MATKRAKRTDDDDGWPWVRYRFDAECVRIQRGAVLDDPLTASLDYESDLDDPPKRECTHSGCAAVVYGTPGSEWLVDGDVLLCPQHKVQAVAEKYEAQRAADPDIRDEDDDTCVECARLAWQNPSVPTQPFVPTLITCATDCGAATSAEAASVMSWTQADNEWRCPDHPRVTPTAGNCKLMGAERCEHDTMTAAETQATFGKAAP